MTKKKNTIPSNISAKHVKLVQEFLASADVPTFMPEEFSRLMFEFVIFLRRAGALRQREPQAMKAAEYRPDVLPGSIEGIDIVTKYLLEYFEFGSVGLVAVQRVHKHFARKTGCNPAVIAHEFSRRAGISVVSCSPIDAFGVEACNEALSLGADISPKVSREYYKGLEFKASTKACALRFNPLKNLPHKAIKTIPPPPIKVS